MTRTLDLMVDIDDVIFPTMESIHALAYDAGLHDGTARMAWSGWENYRLPDGRACDPDTYWDLWGQFARDGGYLHTPPIPGAAEALRWLSWEGHRIHLVTARGFMSNADNIRAWTPRWIETYAIPHKTLTFAKDKVAAQEELGVRFDSAIDDHPKNYQALEDAGVKAYLLDHQHNEDYPAKRRVASLWEWAFQLEKDEVPA